MTINSTQFVSCRKCREGNTDYFRLGVRSEVNSEHHLFHAHRDDTLQTILIRLCDQYPKEWSKGIVYYFYLDFGGSYYAAEESVWLRDRDQILVSTYEDSDLIPNISMNAVHASFRDEVSLLPHQEEGVQTMVHMERSQRGGILADDMGLGKTVQILALIMRQQPKLAVRSCTLVVVPTRGVAEHWKAEIRKMTTYGSIPYFFYQKETATLLDQNCFRIAIATYDCLRAEYTNQSKKGVPSPLLDSDWHRVVLDESHKIRTSSSQVTLATQELSAKYRWCLTGTPLQNNITELHPIFAFLRIPIEVKEKNQVEYMARLLKKHMIRRTKPMLEQALTILPRDEIRITLEFSKPERALYDYLEQNAYQEYIRMNAGQKENTTASTAVLYLRLKQLCVHFQVLLEKFDNLISMASSGDSRGLTEALCASEDQDVNQVQGRETNNEAEYVFEIIESYYDQFGVPENKPDLESMRNLAFIENSTKTIWLLDFLQKTLRSSRTDKIVIVSQFVGILEIIVQMLKSRNLKYVTYTGEMSNHDREDSIRQFNSHPEVRIMALSLKAGGLGLNLQRANHMVIMDRWWNPATMDQVVSRIHRMTQTKQTYIYTVVIKDTIEENLMDGILEKKSKLFNAVVDCRDEEREYGYDPMDETM
ncbi:SNF2 family N-terminal domain-containing protein [Phycomyces nitens]|nr:SNF2 family N-terminal domain-containing protein [Phycomyces nitens]